MAVRAVRLLPACDLMAAGEWVLLIWVGAWSSLELLWVGAQFLDGIAEMAAMPTMISV